MPKTTSTSAVVSRDEAFRAWFDDFYRTHFRAVVAFLVRAGAEPAEAEDAAQSAMVALLVHHESIRDGAAWIRAVARNSWLRSLRRQPVAVRPEAIDAQIDSHDAGDREDPAGIVQRRLQRDAATELVRRLPPTQRRVVALVADGYNSDEIASMLGSSPAVIRSNLSHARKRLRRVAA